MVQPTVRFPDSTVMPISNPQQGNNVSPMFQTLQLPEFERTIKTT